MYTLYNDGALLFDPRFDEYTVEAPTMTQEANKIDALTFTIYPNHPSYGNISKITSTLSVFKDGALVKQFRPSWSRRAFKNGIQYKCEGILARLNDFKFRPFDYTGTLEGFVEAVLSSYNSRVDNSKKILKGLILVTDNNDYVHYSSVDYLGHWDVLQSRLVETHGGYFIERYSNGAVYLDYLRDEDLYTSLQPIVFGENLTDLFIETDSNETYSVLVPVGADIKTFDEHGDEVTERLTIKTVNDGLDYIENAAGIALYGRRETSYRWDDVTLPQNLLAKGLEYLQRIAVKFKETVQLKAIDLHNMDADIASFNWMDWITVRSDVHDVYSNYLLQKITIPLDNPLGCTIQLGEQRLSLTDRINNTVNSATQAALSDIAKTIKDVTDIDLDEIKETLTAIEDNLRITIGNTETSILLQVMENYVGRSEYLDYKSEVGTNISQTQDSITIAASRLEQYIDKTGSELHQYINGQQTYMRYSTAGLELGAIASQFKTRITNERISFLQDNQEVAYISGRKLYITEAQVTRRLLFGVGDFELFGWVVTEQGLGMQYIGERANV